jgi:hypothetical protein
LRIVQRVETHGADRHRTRPGQPGNGPRPGHFRGRC